MIRVGVVEDSFLRRTDPRTRIALALLVSVAVMLPLAPLAAFAAVYVAFVVAAGVGAQAWEPVWRIRRLLLLLFVVDWLFVGLDLAVVVTLRLGLLVTAFQVVLATTRPEELREALERLGMPERIAFSLSVAQRSLGDFEREWRRILEAQQARGIEFVVDGDTRMQRLRRWWRQSLGLVVPAIVLATQRAWAAHEAAAARGLGSAPASREPAPLPKSDLFLLAGVAACFLGLTLWR
jgi:energy-coupling factor transporter transmembrane protein EcfT